MQLATKSRVSVGSEQNLDTEAVTLLRDSLSVVLFALLLNFPYPLHSVLTDNGSEFMKHFHEEVRGLHNNHWHTHPKTPKMNVNVERFNRTLQKEFIDYHEELLTSPDLFNRKLIP